MSAPTLLAVAHGSRRPAAQANTEALMAAVRTARPGLTVRHAYIELAEPLLPNALTAIADDVVVVPLLLGNGYHIAHDVAAVAACHRPTLTGRGPACAPALGPDLLLAAALADRLAAAERRARAPRRGPVVLAAAGSSDPRSHADTEATAKALANRIERPVIPAYNSSARPSVAASVAALRAAGHAHVAVASYLLGPGRFAAEVRACGADVVAEPLGAHPALVQLILRRYDDARAAGAAVPAGARAAR